MSEPSILSEIRKFPVAKKLDTSNKLEAPASVSMSKSHEATPLISFEVAPREGSYLEHLYSLAQTPDRLEETIFKDLGVDTTRLTGEQARSFLSALNSFIELQNLKYSELLKKSRLYYSLGNTENLGSYNALQAFFKSHPNPNNLALVFSVVSTDPDIIPGLYYARLMGNYMSEPYSEPSNRLGDTAYDFIADIISSETTVTSYLKPEKENSLVPSLEKDWKKTLAKEGIKLLEQLGKESKIFMYQDNEEEQDFVYYRYRRGFDSLHKEALIRQAAFKTLIEHGATTSLEDFQHTSFRNVGGSDLYKRKKGEVAHMRALYADSMQGYPEATTKELLADFDRHIQDGRSTFSILRYKDEIAGFLCFTETKPGQKYISAVTLDPRFQKAYIGETMIDEAFAREADENILGADCVAQKSVSARYIENGFIGVRSWNDKGDLIMDIVRDDRRNEKYFSTKSLTQEEIVRLAPLGKIGSAHVEAMDDPKEHSFSLCNEGFVLTRYFKDKATKKWYLVYEPKPVAPDKNKTQAAEEEALV